MMDRMSKLHTKGRSRRRFWQFFLLVSAAFIGCDRLTPVEPEPAFDLAPRTPTLFLGMSVRLDPGAASSSTGKWASSNPSIVAIDGTGLIVGVALGSSTIRYTTADSFGETIVNVVEGGGML